MKHTRLFLPLIAAAAATAFLAPTASAAPGNDPDATAELIARVTPSTGPIITVPVRGETNTIVSEKASVSVGRDQGRPILIDPDNGLFTIRGVVGV